MGATPAGFTMPAYGQRSLVDIVPAAGTALGRAEVLGPTGLELPEGAAYVIFLIDGLGARLLERYAHAAPYLAGLLAAQRPGTAGVPSTTATSLTSLGTALPPGGHGLVGFSARVPGTDLLLNHLLWDQDVDPIEWQPHPTAFARLHAAGVAVSVINQRKFDGTGLTVAAHRGGDYIGADKAGERIAAAVSASAQRPSLTYLYDADLDWTGHQWGVASRQWLQQLSMIDAEAEQLREALPADRRLLVVADHGMVDAPDQHRLDIDEEPVLRHGVSLVGGEARFRHLYCQRGALPDVLSTWRDLLGERAVVLSRDEAITAGWFGAVGAPVLPRIGDVVVACRDDHVILSGRDFPYEATLVGFHGSLTPDEMLIPIVVD